jgi:hypothetical protein
MDEKPIADWEINDAALDNGDDWSEVVFDTFKLIKKMTSRNPKERGSAKSAMYTLKGLQAQLS